MFFSEKIASSKPKPTDKPAGGKSPSTKPGPTTSKPAGKKKTSKTPTPKRTKAQAGSKGAKKPAAKAGAKGKTPPKAKKNGPGKQKKRGGKKAAPHAPCHKSLKIKKNILKGRVRKPYKYAYSHCPKTSWYFVGK